MRLFENFLPALENLERMIEDQFDFIFLFLLRFVDLISLDNDIAGVEYIDASAQGSPWGGATVQDSLFVGHSELRELSLIHI